MSCVEPVYDWIIRDRNTEWHDKFFTKQAKSDHQAKGSCPLCVRVIEFMEEQQWLRPGDIVLDPMCGIGSFPIVAASRGYDSIGVELETKFVQDMLGFDTPMESDSLFPAFPVHTEGTIEKFRNRTAGIKGVGAITIIQGDARNLSGVFGGLDGIRYDVATRLAPHLIKVISSPPYGNRLRDEGQSFGSKDYRTWKELEDELRGSYDRQYSNDPDNIGTAKIKVISSPPYSRSTEHSESQIDALPDEKKVGHKGFQYTRGNIALLKDSRYNREMLKVYRSLYSVLAPGAFVALITKDFIQQGMVVQLHKLTIRLMERAGFNFVTMKRAQLPDISFFIRINYNKEHKKKGLPLIDWNDVTFYQKEV